MLTEELLDYLFEGGSHPLTQPLTTWLTTSRRFTTFVADFRDKIRKKLRTSSDPERLLDLQLELETAYLLLQERSVSLMYEPQLGQTRCPDFAVTFTTRLTFMVEVTRLHATTHPHPSASTLSERLAETMCSKLGQLLSHHSNVLLIGLDAPGPTPDDLHAAIVHVQQRAEQNDARLLQRHAFRKRADFFRGYQRLSELIVRGAPGPTERPVVWVNPQASHPLPSKVRTALYHSLST